MDSKVSRPTTGDTSHGGSFYTAEVYLDGELDLSGSPRQAGSSTKWLIPKDTMDTLPSIPAPVHMPLPTSPRRHARNRLGAGALTEPGLSPPAPAMTSEPSARPSFHSTLHPASLPSSWVELTEIQDRTPTQSLYLSSTSLNIAIASADRDHIPMVATISASTSVGALEDAKLYPQALSMCSLPSIPSTPDTPEQTFETELSEELGDDTLNTETRRDSSFLGVLPSKPEDDGRVSVGAFVH